MRTAAFVILSLLVLHDARATAARTVPPEASHTNLKQMCTDQMRTSASSLTASAYECPSAAGALQFPFSCSNGSFVINV